MAGAVKGMRHTFLSFDFSTPSSFCAFFACRLRLFAVNCATWGHSDESRGSVRGLADLELEEGLYSKSG